MNKTGWISAFITFMVTLATALAALWTQPDVLQFSDIPEVTYAAAVAGALIAGFNTYKARLAQSPPPP